MNHTIIPLAMSTSSNFGGYLELIIGPMYSGKTSKLLELYKQFTFCGIKTLVINYSEDKRYSETELSTHDKIMIPCKQAYDLFDDICSFEDGEEAKNKFKDFYESQFKYSNNLIYRRVKYSRKNIILYKQDLHLNNSNH